MGVQSNVAALKQQFEHLFPGKWVSGASYSKNILTGLPDLDHSLIRGLSRQRITEWVGPASSGKTSLLRAVIANWCRSGLHVAYVDVGSKLMASDWAYVAEGQCGAVPLPVAPPSPDQSTSEQPAGRRPLSIAAAPARARTGKFWVVRLNTSTRHSHVWTADQLIRCGEFDVVVLDLGSTGSIDNRSQKADRMAARLQRSLSQSRAALLVVRDGKQTESGWGCHIRVSCHWSRQVHCDSGPSGITMIVPGVDGAVWKDGISRPAKTVFTSNVTNCLFTHSPVPDRRTPKA